MFTGLGLRHALLVATMLAGWMMRLTDAQGSYPHGAPYAVPQKARPVLKSAPTPLDTDHDGMPDAWETAHKLNPRDAADRGKIGKDGTTMLEVYMKELAGK